MSTYSTPYMGFVRPVPGSAEPYITSRENSAWEAVDAKFQAVDTTVAAQGSSDDARLDALEPLVLPGGANAGVTPRGTTAQRNTHWGTPGTAAARVALANKGARWFNLDLGYEEQYFSGTADAGMSPLVSTPSAGWYPSGVRMKPFVLVDKTIAQSTASGNATLTLAATAAYDIYGMYNPAQNTRLTAPIGGLYRCTYRVRTNSATLPLAVAAYRNGTVYARGSGSAAAMTGGASSVSETFTVFMSAGQYLELVVSSTGVTPIILGGETFFELEYIGPPPA